MICPKCGSTDIRQDRDGLSIYCFKCGKRVYKPFENYQKVVKPPPKGKTNFKRQHVRVFKCPCGRTVQTTEPAQKYCNRCRRARAGRPLPERKTA